MKDLDFDELDKAVSSLMADAPSQTPVPKQDDDVQTITLPESAIPEVPVSAPVSEATAEAAAPAVKPSSDTTSPAPEESPVLNPTPKESAPSLATKRSGRFMDVVHPSSDMRKAGTLTSRSAATIAPLNPDVAPESAQPEATQEEMSASEPVTMPEPVSPTPSEITTSWPDPIDMHEQQSADSQPEQTPVEPATEQTNTTPEEAAPVDETSLADMNEASSPFLPDAKVEKRPLGGGNEATAPSSVVADEKIADPLPAELNSDVLAIESNSTPLASEEAVVASDESGDVSESDTAPLQGGTTEPAPAPRGPVSIAQQYKAEENTRDQSHAPLYDSVADSHALTHPAKKRSGIWVVLAIIALIAIGAGIGAFAYFQGLI